MRGLSETGRTLLRWTGLAASVAAVAAFLYVFAQHVPSGEAQAIARDHWPTLVAVLGLYGVAYVPMTLAWIGLARGAGAETDNVALARVLLVSQIGKYLPGNVAQLFGRAYMARSCGVPLKASALAMALELAGVLAACSLLAGIALGSGAVAGQGLLLYVVGATTILALAGSIFLLRTRMALNLVGPFAFAVACYVALLALLAGANALLVGELTGDWSGAMAAQVAGALVVSWLVGFATPGSPAGLGLREVSFLSLLAGLYPDQALLFAAAGFRLATMTGDIIAWAVGMALLRPRWSGRRAAV